MNHGRKVAQVPAQDKSIAGSIQVGRVIKLSSPERKNFRGYMAFWSGQMISTFGTNIVQFAIIIWFAIVTGSPLILGLAGFGALGTQLALTPIAGVYVDRWSRKKVIAVSDGLQAVAALILIYFFFTGQATVWHVLIILSARGGLGAFHDPAFQAVIPIMVPERWLSRINGLTLLATGMSAAIGAPTAVLLYSLLGGDLARILWIDVITFLIAVVPTVIVYIPRVDKGKSRGEKVAFRSEFSEGLTFIRKKRGLLTLLSTFTIANFLLVPLGVLLPLFSIQILAKGDTTTGKFLFGFLSFLTNVSLLVGAGIMTAWKGFKRNIVGVVGGLALGSIGMLLFALSTHIGSLLLWLTPQAVVYVAAFGALLVGLVVPIANVSSQTIWQKIVPPEKLGRVFSVRLALAQMSAPFAMLFSGLAADLIGMQMVLLICGGLELLVLVVTWSMTSLPHVEDTILENQKPPEEGNLKNRK
ncbi:MAG: MFS transporter [Promethearchaeati archaeon SRVP18_Atabeyarchaeia-1]